MKDNVTTPETTWRTVAVTFTDIGRNLQIIEHAIRSINATAVVDDVACERIIDDAWRAAKALVKEFDNLRYMGYADDEKNAGTRS